MVNVTTVLGIGLVLAALILDSLNLWWGFRSAKRVYYKSGFAILPALGYVAGGYLLGMRFGIALVLGVGIHVFCYQIGPWIFDRHFGGK